MNRKLGRNAKPSKGSLIARQAAAAVTRRRARAEALLDLIARRVARIKEDFYELGAALKELRDEKLYAALGYRTFDDLLAKRRPIGRSQAYKLIALVENVSREQALELGEEKAYALARLAKATPTADTVDSLLDRGIEIGASHQRVKAMSVREIEKTRRRVVESHRKPPPEELAAKRAARDLQRALRDRGVPARVTVLRHGKKWWARIEAPIEKVPLLAGER
jgi:hypothetical protein